MPTDRLVYVLLLLTRRIRQNYCDAGSCYEAFNHIFTVQRFQLPWHIQHVASVHASGCGRSTTARLPELLSPVSAQPQDQAKRWTPVEECISCSLTMHIVHIRQGFKVLYLFTELNPFSTEASSSIDPAKLDWKGFILSKKALWMVHSSWQVLQAESSRSIRLVRIGMFDAHGILGRLHVGNLAKSCRG